MIHTSRIASVSKPALLLSLILVATLAGCVDEPAGDCVNGVCTETAKPGDAFLTNATRPTAEFPECTGALLLTEVTRESLDGHLPSAFVAGGFTGATATLLIDVWDCERATVQNQSAANLRVLTTMVFAQPLNDSWGPAVVGHYAFEILVNDAQIAERFRSWGLPAHSADIDKTPVEAGPVRRADWVATADDRSYAFSITEVGGQGGGVDGPFVLWAGSDDIWRVDRNRTERTTTGGQGLEIVTMSGEATYAAVLGREVHPFKTQPYDVISDSWRPYPHSFSP